MSAYLLAHEGLRSGFLRHGAHNRAQLLVALTIAMHEHREQQVGHLGKSPALGERDQSAPALALFRRVGSRRSIEQREPRHPLGRLAHDRKGDIAPIDRPTSAKRGGSVARMWAAIAAMLSSRRWSATVTGPKPQSTGICSAYRRAVQLSPGTRTIGKGPLMSSPFRPKQEKLGINAAYCTAS
jgi:hypothetical protein